MHPINALTQCIIGCAIEVHKELGPGLLENAYERCLTIELVKAELEVERQKPIPLIYQQERIECAYRLDLLINQLVVVEVKSVERLTNVHRAQMMSYLKMTECKVGLVFNFNVKHLTSQGIMRVVNSFEE